MKKHWGFLFLALAMALGLAAGLFAAAPSARAEDRIKLYYIPEAYAERVPMPAGGQAEYQLQAAAGATFAVSLPEEPKANAAQMPLKVSDSGLVTACDSSYFSTAYGYRLSVDVAVTEGDATRTVGFVVEYYPYYYVDIVMDNYIATEITATMTTEEKVRKIAEICGRDYDYGSSTSWSGMILTGSGSCWGATSFVCEGCRRLGIPAAGRRADRDGGAGSAHRNAMVDIDGQLWIVEAGYSGKKPRGYSMWRAKDYMWGTATGASGEKGAWLYQYELFFAPGREREQVLTVPDTFEGYPVIGLGEQVFVNCGVEEFVLPASLETIDKYAFAQNDKLKKINLPEGLLTIGDDAFEGCSLLRQIHIPASVTSIGEGAFDHCTITICGPAGSYAQTYCEEKGYHFRADGETSDFEIKDGALLWYSGTDSAVTVPDGVTAIGDSAFKNRDFVTAVTLPEGVTAIGQSAFENTGLKRLKLPEGLATLGERAFGGCAALEEVECASGLKTIGDSAFYGCEKLGKLALPEGMTTIGNGAFNMCAALSELTLPEGLTTIEDSAFLNCDALQTLTIPRSVTTLGDYALTYLDNTVVRVYRGSPAHAYCDRVRGKDPIRCVLAPEPLDVSRVSLSKSEALVGEKLSVEIDADPYANWLHMLDENGKELEKWQVGYSNYKSVIGDSTPKTWSIVLTFDAPGERKLTFKASMDGELITGAGLTADLKVRELDCDVKQVSVDNTQVLAGQDVAFTVVTGIDAAYLYGEDANTEQILYYGASDLSAEEKDGVRVWTFTLRFSTGGQRKLTLRAMSNRSVYGATQDVTLTVRVPDISVKSVALDGDAVVGSEARFTVRTGVDAQFLVLINASRTELARWTAEAASTSDGTERIWSVGHIFAEPGIRSVSFCGSADGWTLSAGSWKDVSVSPAPTAAPAVTEAPAATETPEGTQAPAGTEAPEGTQAPAGTEAPEGTQAPAGTETPDGTQAPAATEAPEGTQGPAATEAPEGTEAPAVTEAPAATQAPAKAPAVKKVVFGAKSATAGEKIAITVTTDKAAKRLRLYDASDKALKTWKASKNSSVSGSKRVWKLKYAFKPAGTCQMSFRASADGETYGEAKRAKLKVVAPPPAVTKVKADAGKVKAGDKVTFTVTTEAHAKKLTLFDAKGKALTTWKASKYAKKKDGKLMWTVRWKAAGKGKQKLTFKALKSGKQYGKAKSITVKVK